MSPDSGGRAQQPEPFSGNFREAAIAGVEYRPNHPRDETSEDEFSEDSVIRRLREDDGIDHNTGEGIPPPWDGPPSEPMPARNEGQNFCRRR